MKEYIEVLSVQLKLSTVLGLGEQIGHGPYEVWALSVFTNYDQNDLILIDTKIND